MFVHSLDDLRLISTWKGVMFMNKVLTDRITCGIMFCRKKSTSQESISPQLELKDFNDDDINLFRVCTVDPGRTHCFTSYHGTHYRQMFTKEFYSFGGTIQRQQALEKKKNETGIKLIDSNIPTLKTMSISKYNEHLRYIFRNLDRLFAFYNFETCKSRWLNYIGKIKAREEVVNIHINGEKKYNKKTRIYKKTKKNKAKRKKARVNRRRHNTPSPTNTRQYNPQADIYRRNVLEQGHTTKMPTVVFGIVDIIYQNLKRRELILLDITEFRISVVSIILLF
jgi:hypothetical protein